jgi:acyl-CoA synthetase (AMP-forming)/AMP-acid ligase II
MSKKILPWLEEYKVFGIPKSLKPYPDKPVFEILYKTAKKYKRRGLIQFNYQMNYPAVKDHVDRMATALHAMGLKKGDRVATILPTSIQFVIADYAISRAGLVHISTSSLEPVKNLERKFREGTPKALICLDEYLDLAREILERAATVGVPDPERQGSERVAVYIQPKPEFMEKLTEDEIVDYLRPRTAKYAVPKFVRIMGEVPLTEVQKLDKNAVRKMAIKAFGRLAMAVS